MSQVKNKSPIKNKEGNSKGNDSIINTPGGLSTNKDQDDDHSKGPFLTSLQEPKIGE